MGVARYAAAACGMEDIPGQSVNRHCAGSLTAIGNAAAQIGSGMETVLIAGGVQSLSMTPVQKWRVPGPELKFEEPWMPPTHPESADAPTKDMSITVGWNTAQEAKLTREELDLVYTEITALADNKKGLMDEEKLSKIEGPHQQECECGENQPGLDQCAATSAFVLGFGLHCGS